MLYIVTLLRIKNRTDYFHHAAWDMEWPSALPLLFAGHRAEIIRIMPV